MQVRSSFPISTDPPTKIVRYVSFMGLQRWIFWWSRLTHGHRWLKGLSEIQQHKHIKMNSWISWESGLDAQQRRPKAENVTTSLLCYQGPTKVNKQYTYVVLLIVDKQYTYCCSVDKRYCRQYSWYRQYSQQTIYIVLLSWQYLIFANLAIWLHLLPPNVKGKRYWTLSFPFLAKERFPQWSLGDVE